jgi:ubiquinone/menaquinone biosynthesis C-methylase UbiE
MKMNKPVPKASKFKHEYKTLARIYDEWDKAVGVDYIGTMIPKIDGVFKKKSFLPFTIADVGCGTGKLSIALSQRGIKCYAVDRSPSMLQEARRKVVRKKLPIVFKRQDMRFLQLPEKVDAVVSLGDALNHLLTEEDLRKTCDAVKKTLKKGGIFIFDLINEHGYSSVLSKTFLSETPRFDIFYQGHYNGEARLYQGKFICFIREGRTYVKKIDELSQYCFHDEEVKNILKNSGFNLIEYERFTPIPQFPLGDYRSFFAGESVS